MRSPRAALYCGACWKIFELSTGRETRAAHSQALRLMTSAAMVSASTIPRRLAATLARARGWPARPATSARTTMGPAMITAFAVRPYCPVAQAPTARSLSRRAVHLRLAVDTRLLYCVSCSHRTASKAEGGLHCQLPDGLRNVCASACVRCPDTAAGELRSLCFSCASMEPGFDRAGPALTSVPAVTTARRRTTQHLCLQRHVRSRRQLVLLAARQHGRDVPGRRDLHPP